MFFNPLLLIGRKRHYANDSNAVVANHDGNADESTFSASTLFRAASTDGVVA